MRAEHSTYLTAFNSRANFSPWSIVITRCLFLANFSTVAWSSRKSIWVPTNKNGVFWQWCVISGTHCRIKICQMINNKSIALLKLALPFLSRFQRKKVKPQRSTQGKHLSGGNSEVLICRNLPDLYKQNGWLKMQNYSLNKRMLWMTLLMYW